MRFRFCRDFKPYFGAYAASNKVALEKNTPVAIFSKSQGNADLTISHPATLGER